METKKLIDEELLLDAQVKIEENGNFCVAPLPWECTKALIMSENKVVIRGSITMMDDGTIEFHRYNIGSQLPLYNTLFKTEHCEVLLSRGGQLVERWKFDHKLSFHQVCAARKRERKEVDAFYRTVKNMYNL